MRCEEVSEPTECRLVLAVADIDGFYKVCQSKSDLDTFRMLDSFYHLVEQVVAEAGGQVVKFMGDSAFIVFPEDKAKQAVAALQDLKSQAQTLWSEFDAKCLVRTKAHLDSVVCGPIGPEKRFDVIGKALNELFRRPRDASELSEQLKALVV